MCDLRRIDGYLRAIVFLAAEIGMLMLPTLYGVSLINKRGIVLWKPGNMLIKGHGCWYQGNAISSSLLHALVQWTRRQFWKLYLRSGGEEKELFSSLEGNKHLTFVLCRK